MKVLYVASESSPFIKTGGLADVAGSLPQALRHQGIDVRVVLPLYSQIKQKYKEEMKDLGYFYIDLNWRHQYVGVYYYKFNDVPYYFIDNEYYFDRSSPYGEEDDGERFIYFNKAVVTMLKYINFDVDIVHSNDWHTGLIPLYIKEFANGDSFYEPIKTVHTIHNLKYQGVFPESILGDVADLSDEYYHEDGLKFYDNINMMKGGIVYSNALTTVSKTYANEIKSAYFGEQLEGIITQHASKLTGIVNGIDKDLFNPKTDSNIKTNYTIQTIDKKIENKTFLQESFGLPVRDEVFMIGMVGRLVEMKGLNLVRHILDELLQEDIQFVMLGTGDNEFEAMFKHFQDKYPDKMSARVYFNEADAHKIYAGADAFLMPSLKEPCGISQLIALRYGTIPIVRETGGLKDTISPYNQYTNEGNGFSFEHANAHELLFTIKKAHQLYDDSSKWKELMIRAMTSNNDWEQSSKEYDQLYRSLLA